jgi:ABC-type multidrug transport system fused ATPase/permease subunit
MRRKVFLHLINQEEARVRRSNLSLKAKDHPTIVIRERIDVGSYIRLLLSALAVIATGVLQLSAKAVSNSKKDVSSVPTIDWVAIGIITLGIVFLIMWFVSLFHSWRSPYRNLDSALLEIKKDAEGETSSPVDPRSTSAKPDSRS